MEDAFLNDTDEHGSLLSLNDVVAAILRSYDNGTRSAFEPAQIAQVWNPLSK